eukprot:CAMPEP_0197058244 /NCGR_PEP_ID=MMETSP1384-20130603/105570_1 /TAXON_ID=29189 /ORGANISM="Ammonia sp." /LENGTH=74 /DNA_ID=CAMNT_0042492925 /DNA_START=53 /DNA_END=274 /DNA_ORIENTATION=-
MSAYNVTIKCTNNGDMSSNQRDVVLRVIQYCDAHSNISCSAMRDRLKALGYKGGFIKDDKDWAFWGLTINWSVW